MNKERQEEKLWNEHCGEGLDRNLANTTASPIARNIGEEFPKTKRGTRRNTNQKKKNEIAKKAEIAKRKAKKELHEEEKGNISKIPDKRDRARVIIKKASRKK